jgi:hypothetical protein
MYEIGLAHAIGKPLILLTRKEEDVPFDLRALRFIYYNPNDPFWGDNLRSELTRVIRMVLQNPALGVHLEGVQVETALPEIPTHPVPSKVLQIIPPDLGGVWRTSWLSVQREREHKALLVIQPGHGPRFIASMTVTYERGSQRTIVQESLTGDFRDDTLFLTGVNYTYVEQGGSSSYGLDSFELRPSADHKTLTGKAILRHGVRDVSFTLLQDLAP